MKDTIIIEGATLVFPARLDKGSITIANGRIVNIGRESSRPLNAAIYNLSGLYVAPGFIDLQVNGGAGHNFNDAPFDEIRKIAEFHISHGTIGIVATIITAPIPTIRDAIQKTQGSSHPAILGVHMEGPFISPKQKGAHNLEYILPPFLNKFDELVEEYESFVRIVTLAPELPGAEELIARICKIGAVASLGHSDASYDQALAAAKSGVKLFTHLGNAVRGLHHREPGAVGAALDSDTYVELICDGVHLHPAFVRLVAKIKGFDRICLVTDAISAAGLPDGEYSFGGLPVFVQNGIARLSDGTLAGSTLTMNRAVKNFMEFTGCSLPEAVRCATLNPARLLGLDDRKGSLAVGKDADLVIFDEDFTVHYTILGGEVAYARRTDHYTPSC